jgi:hypothetical protein
MPLAGCGDEAPGEDAATRLDETFCGDLTDAAFDPSERWLVNGLVDEEDESATCTITGPEHRIDVVVRTGDDARSQFDQTSSELEDGAVGFQDAEVTRPDGWWTEGQQYVADADGTSIRVADVVLGDEVFARIQLAELIGGKPRDLDQRRDLALRLTDDLITAVPEALSAE